ncbi:trimeric intracellular cation channel family protein [Streptomyces smyrnaeus]|uniref:trimeric intracellular cation channel family protein n=1 Tax=Streptomyces TaxID=1883 RepID=UPI000C175D45|nr:MULTISPECIES: trimeric intracellular cation channel family protein [unclassified Streptomyces]MBQ0865273.1 trimeric intracellular cation channel family protein [Streptomyces sp. RK75]MBQ1121856.1 trimeric intracellular cation channel family protein [Streptomyces sp. B15]MBQ1158002.1 trimeric intracellular cation channel family protein [Streptomyces sp. A73]
METLFSPPLQHWLDIAGIFVFAVSGALLAVRRNFDVFGIAVLAEVTGLGGGLFRDVVIGAVPPAAFTDLGYFLTPLVATVLVFFLHPEVERINKAVSVFDAAGLGLFCVTGTLKAHEFGLSLTSSVVMGLATAAGGGVLRDVLANEVPSLLRWDREIYAVPAIVGSSAVALLIHLDAVRPGTAVGAALLAFVLRLLALRYNWRAPRAWKRSSATADTEGAGGTDDTPTHG